MTTAVIVGGVMLVGMGMVASQLFGLKDWLERQPPPPPPASTTACAAHVSHSLEGGIVEVV